MYFRRSTNVNVALASQVTNWYKNAHSTSLRCIPFESRYVMLKSIFRWSMNVNVATQVTNWYKNAHIALHRDVSHWNTQSLEILFCCWNVFLDEARMWTWQLELLIDTRTHIALHRNVSHYRTQTRLIRQVWRSCTESIRISANFAELSMIAEMSHLWSAPDV